MSADAIPDSLREALDVLEQKTAELRATDDKAQSSIEQLRRQIHDLLELVDEQKSSVRDVSTRISSLRNVPDQLRALSERTEGISQDLSTARAELENSLRLVQAETGVQREQVADVFRRLEELARDLEQATAGLARLQVQVANASQLTQTLVSSQESVETSVEELALRIERSLELHKSVEERLRTQLREEQEARFDVIFERLQILGEMVGRNEQLLQELTAEQTLREEVLQEINVWRDQHHRLEGKLHELEESVQGALNRIDRVQAEVTLVEGRHTGLSERVATMRRDISEIIDHVREEFTNFNRIIEKQRRKQIDVLEQELRELKFHALHPPEEK